MQPDATRQSNTRIQRYVLLLALLAMACGTNGIRQSESQGTVPPDPHIAAGIQFVLERVNHKMRAINKLTGVVTTMGTPNACSGTIVDGQIVYDFLTNRFFEVHASNVGILGFWCLAVTATSDPTGSWLTYYLEADLESLPDQPTIGVDDSKVVLTGIHGGKTEILVLNKADVLAGAASPRSQHLVASQELFWLYRAVRPTSSTTNAYLLPNLSEPIMYLPGMKVNESPSSRMGMIYLRGTPGVGLGVQALGATWNLSNSRRTPPAGADQGGSAALLDLADTRPQDAVFRAGVIWVAMDGGCKPFGDPVERSCSYFDQFYVTGSPWETPFFMTHQQSLVFGTYGAFYYYPAVQIDAVGNLFAVMNRSAAYYNEYPAIYATGQRFGHQGLIGPYRLRASATPYYPGVGGCCLRWGDYSGAALDAADPSVVWFAAEYAIGPQEWGTWIVRLTAADAPS